MNYATIAKAVVGAIGELVLAAILFLAWDRGHQKNRADAAARCEVAALSADKALGDCGPNVTARVSADRQTIVCEGALLPQLRDETRFTAHQSCGAGTLRLIAQGDAQASQIAGLQAELAKARSDNADAIARAEARVRSEQTRKSNAQQVIQAAPRSADGRIACDAACLRKLAQ